MLFQLVMMRITAGSVVIGTEISYITSSTSVAWISTVAIASHKPTGAWLQASLATRDGRTSNFLHQHFWVFGKISRYRHKNRHFEIMLNAANSIKEGL